MKQIIIFVILIVTSCLAHVCFLNPEQRGGVNSGINQIASNECFQTTAPCGSFPQGAPEVFYASGENITVIFQKNLNHWDATNPGNFTVNFSENGMMWKNLASMPDNNDASLTLFTLNVTIPNIKAPKTMLQVIYAPNGPPGPFYQCADIGIF